MNKILYIALTAAIFAGCSKENPEPQGNRSEPISFEMSIAPPQALSRAATNMAFNTTWEAGDKIGLFAVRHAAGKTASLAPEGNFLHNEPLTRSANSNRWVSANPLFMPTNGDQLDFYAYYPYDATATDPTAIAFKVNVDQNSLTDGQSNFSRSDLMFSNTTKNIGPTKLVRLSFTHQMAMVQVAVSSAYDAEKVVLQGFITSGSANISSGFTTKGESDSISMFCADKSATTYTTYDTYRALVPAQSINSGSMLRVTSSSDKSYSSSALTTGVTFTAGSAETYTLESIVPYAVGDLYPNAKAPIGVVFWIDETDATYNSTNKTSVKGKIVGLIEGVDKRWGPMEVYEESEGINSTTDGAPATKNLIKAHLNNLNFSLYYSAFAWVYATVNGGNIDGRWYIPAIDEFMTIYGEEGTTRVIVNASLATIKDATPMNKMFYHTSTQKTIDYSWCINYFDGIRNDGDKKWFFNVRVISTF